jgi:hypothetical protein
MHQHLKHQISFVKSSIGLFFLEHGVELCIFVKEENTKDVWTVYLFRLLYFNVFF